MNKLILAKTKNPLKRKNKVKMTIIATSTCLILASYKPPSFWVWQECSILWATVVSLLRCLGWILSMITILLLMALRLSLDFWLQVHQNICSYLYKVRYEKKDRFPTCFGSLRLRGYALRFQFCLSEYIGANYFNQYFAYCKL